MATRSVAVWVLLAVVATGCVAPSEGPATPSATPSSAAASRENPAFAPVETERVECPSYSPEPADYPVPKWQGGGSFLLRPASPELTPGQPLRLNVTFQNVDCRDYHVYFPCLNFLDRAIRIGSPPLEITEENLDRPTAAAKICLAAIRFTTVRPGQLYAREIAWNGSFLLWDHGAVERGEDWRQIHFWAAPGTWPLSYGFTGDASYPTERQAQLEIRANALNADRPLHPGRCASAGIDLEHGPDFAEAGLAVHPAKSRLGTPVAVWMNYTLEIPEPGCWIVGGAPEVIGHDAEGRPHFGIGRACGGDIDQVLLRSSTGSVSASIRFEWDGTQGCEAAPVPSGPMRLSLTWSGLPEPPGPATAEVEWLPA